jgi:hypothetical protein
MMNARAWNAWKIETAECFLMVTRLSRRISRLSTFANGLVSQAPVLKINASNAAMTVTVSKVTALMVRVLNATKMRIAKKVNCAAMAGAAVKQLSQNATLMRIACRKIQKHSVTSKERA